MHQHLPHILFLSADVQPFLQAGIEALVQQHNVKVTLIARSIPTPFAPHPQLATHLLEACTETDFATFTQPNLVVCAGWMIRRYLAWSKAFKEQGVPTVCCMDTPWKGTFKQWIHTAIAPVTTRKYFTHAWVPGLAQRRYAAKLGFASQHILPHLLAANTAWFAQAFPPVYQKRFLFAGRLLERKLLATLKAFAALTLQERQGWSFTIVGNGPLATHSAMKTEGIEHLPHQDTRALRNEFKKGGVFILAAKEEPWGVALQEAASAGLPLIASKQCGSSSVFLQDGKNGFLVDGHQANDIKKAMLQCIAMDENTWRKCSQKSHTLGEHPNTSTWAAVLMELLKKTL